MNLCLRSAGKARCAPDAPGTLQTLCRLLDHDNDQVRTYIHGTLYSLLSAPAIRKAAQAMGMESIVNKQIEMSNNPKLVVQLEYILQQMDPDASTANATDPDGAESEDGEDDDEPDEGDDDGDDLMMADASEGETLKEDGSAVGEQLLERDYLHTSSSKTSSRPAPLREAVGAGGSGGGRPASSTRATSSGEKPRKPKGRADPAALDAPPSRPLTPVKTDKSRPNTSMSSRASSTRPPTGGAPSSSMSRPTTGHRTRPSSTNSSRLSTGASSRPASSRSRPASSRSRQGPTPTPAAVTAPPPPSQKALATVAQNWDEEGNAMVKEEYNNAFSSRPKMPRTPSAAGRGSSEN
jgi:hypothetical protein